MLLFGHEKYQNLLISPKYFEITVKQAKARRILPLSILKLFKKGRKGELLEKSIEISDNLLISQCVRVICCPLLQRESMIYVNSMINQLIALWTYGIVIRLSGKFISTNAA